jgi:hypothetical protein
MHAGGPLPSNQCNRFPSDQGNFRPIRSTLSVIGAVIGLAPRDRHATYVHMVGRSLLPAQPAFIRLIAHEPVLSAYMCSRSQTRVVAATAGGGCCAMLARMA